MSASLCALPEEWARLDWRPTGIGSALLSWWGADHASWTATAPGGEEVIAKAPRVHAVGSSAVAARIAAAAAGVGPEVLAAAPRAGVSVERALGDGWQLANGLRLQRRQGAVAAIATARRTFRESDADLPHRDLGAETQTLLDQLTEHGVGLPPVLAAVAAELDRMREAVADGPAPVPGWLSSEFSDVQLGDDGTVLFTGGTRAGLADPLADVGTILTELTPTVLPPDEGFAILWGDAHPGAYARAQLWGVIEDLRVNLQAMLADRLEPDSPIGYLGYTMWRTWQAEHLVATGALGDLTADAKKGWE